jgi:tetratricopeptide (TPR) repeat protein
MEKESTSFWADIKKYEDILVKDPKSYCFAPLSELYRKLGLLDDALGVAQRGTDIHPEYIGGYMALGRAYFEKGMKDKSKEALERVAKATPENILAQKILSQIYIEEGNTQAAEKALQLLVTFCPEDVESRLTLEAMQKSATSKEDIVPVSAEDNDISVETAADDFFDDAGFAWETETASTEQMGDDSREDFDSEESFLRFEEVDNDEEIEVAEIVPHPSPLPTLTLAELYASQGFKRQALVVYEELMNREPENQLLNERVDSLRRLLDEDSEAPIQVSEEMVTSQIEPLGEPVSAVGEKNLYHEKEISREQMILETLEVWLNSIRRAKECR